MYNSCVVYCVQHYSLQCTFNNTTVYSVKCTTLQCKTLQCTVYNVQNYRLGGGSSPYEHSQTQARLHQLQDRGD